LWRSARLSQFVLALSHDAGTLNLVSRVLVTDGLWRKSLSATRALGRAGVEVTVTGDRRLTTTWFSRYCRRRLRVPAASENPEGFLQGVLAELRRRPYDTVFAMEDASLETLSRHRGELDGYVTMPLPAQESLDVASNKARTLKLARGLGLETPKSVVVNTSTDLEGADLSGPLVVKPVRSSGSRGLRFVETRAELEKTVTSLLAQYDQLLVQERIHAAGQGLGAALLFDTNSRVVAGFTYKRLREYPISGGPSTLRESTNDPELLERARTLLEALQWVGVAMVEFKTDPRDGQPKLMEINPRFWGSLELAIASGVDFPSLLLRVAQGRPFAPVFDYRVGVRCRWLVPGDLLHFLANPDRWHLQPSFFQFRGRDLYYDDFAADDWCGNVGTIVAAAGGLLSPALWRVAIKR
jgi:predicted ATP-grasp superfamily ATP-dependent carboligase